MTQTLVTMPQTTLLVLATNNQTVPTSWILVFGTKCDMHYTKQSENTLPSRLSEKLFQISNKSEHCALPAKLPLGVSAPYITVRVWSRNYSMLLTRLSAEVHGRWAVMIQVPESL